MSNRLAIDPSEIKISDPAAVRRRLWSRSPSPVVEEAPVVKAVEVDIRGNDDDEELVAVVAPPPPLPAPKPNGRPRLPRPPEPIKPQDAIALYRLAYASPGAGRRTLKQIANEIAKVHDVSIAELFGTSRTRPLCTARQHAYYVIATERPDISYPEIARRMGGKDHSTIVHGAAIFARRHGLPPVVRS